MPESETEPQPAAVPPKRRWHQYNLRTLLLLPLLLALALSAVYSWPYVQRRYILWRLQDYVDKELRTLPKEEQHRVDQWSAKLIGENRKPLMLHNADIPGVGRRMLIVELRQHTVSAWLMYGDCRLDSLDSWGRATQVAVLNVGGDPLSVAFDESRHGFLCLTLETGEGVSGATRCFYRFADGMAELIRVEEKDGTLNSTSRISSPPERSDLQSLLESPDRVQQLRGLAAYLYDNNPFHRKHIDDRVRIRLSELANSPDAWIGEEAKMALEGTIKK